MPSSLTAVTVPGLAESRGVEDVGARDHERLVLHHNLRDADRIGIAAEIERTHRARQNLGRLIEADYARVTGPVVEIEIVALSKILRHGRQRARGDALGQLAKSVDAGGKALGVQAERRLVRRDVERTLHENAAFVCARGHFVPRDAVARLVVEQGPHRRVDAGVTRQEAVVKIDGELLGEPQYRVFEQHHVDDREQEVEIGSGRGCQELSTIDDQDSRARAPRP